MRVELIPKSIPWMVGIAGVLAIALWLRGGASGETVSLRLPGSDRIGLGPASRPAAIDLRGKLQRGPAVAADLPGAWPRFRGARLDNISNETIRLGASWSGDPPPLWSIALGEGYAGAAIHQGRVYVMDYDSAEQADVLKCLSLADGGIIWQRSYSVEIKRNHGMSRTVPALTDKFVLAMGPKCHVVCADAVTGEFIWGMDLVAQQNTKVPPWYAGQCPLIDGELAILAPCGDALLMAVECATGRIVWQTPNTLGWEMTHSSIMPMMLGGEKTYVYCGSGGVAGVSAADGRLLWSTTEWKVSMACVPSPVVIDEQRIFLSGGYGAGSMMLGLRRAGDVIVAEPLYRLKPEVFGSEQQTPIFYQGNIYGVIPSGQLVCLDPAGSHLWTSGTRRFGIGPYMVADGKIFLLDDHGTMSVIEATPLEYRELGQFNLIPDGHESWGPLALAGGRLVARDLKRMVCVDLKETGHD